MTRYGCRQGAEWCHDYPFDAIAQVMKKMHGRRIGHRIRGSYVEPPTEESSAGSCCLTQAPHSQRRTHENDTLWRHTRGDGRLGPPGRVRHDGEELIRIILWLRARRRAGEAFGFRGSASLGLQRYR